MMTHGICNRPWLICTSLREDNANQTGPPVCLLHRCRRSGRWRTTNLTVLQYQSLIQCPRRTGRHQTIRPPNTSFNKLLLSDPVTTATFVYVQYYGRQRCASCPHRAVPLRQCRRRRCCCCCFWCRCYQALPRLARSAMARRCSVNSRDASSNYSQQLEVVRSTHAID